jgi:uncharacterized protein (TIGR02145 family)
MKKLYAFKIIQLFIIVQLLYSGILSAQKTFNCGDILTDTRDGKTYRTVKIGTQCWMKDNLNVGTRIDGIVDEANNQIIEKYCLYDDEDKCKTYGGLYDWDEMMQYINIEKTQGICPTGWHIPNEAEWNILIDFLGGKYQAGGAMKETGTVHWNYPNTGATNSSGFTGLPGGYRSSAGDFLVMGAYGNWWSSTELIKTGFYSALRYDLPWDDVIIESGYPVKWAGQSVRCVLGQGAIGIKENKEKQKIRISPNPASDFIYIKTNDFKNNMINVDIYDIMGKLVYSGNINTDNSKINISNFIDGIYMLKLTGNDFSTTEKIVVKH